MCRPGIELAVSNKTVVSCSVAHMICSADAQCHTALTYYDINCRAMFKGKKCSTRCKNSLAILKKQAKASKLRTCYCDEARVNLDFDCPAIKRNMKNMCQSDFSYDPPGNQSNENRLTPNKVETLPVSNIVTLYLNTLLLYYYNIHFYTYLGILFYVSYSFNKNSQLKN